VKRNRAISERNCTVNMWTNDWRRLELISAEGVEAIDMNALRILEEVGLRITYEPTLELLRDAGLKVDGDTVHFDRGFVREALAQAPASFELRARSPRMNFVVGGNHMVNSPTGGAPFVSDLDGGRRPGNVEDYIELVKAAHMSPQIHCVDSGIVETMDLPRETRHLDMDYLVMRYSDKPLMTVGATYETTRDCVEMAAILFGGGEAIEETPGLIGVANPVSPLVWDDHMLGSMHALASANQPVIFTPFLMAGTSAPVTMAGGVAQWCAENLAGIAIVQTIRPGCPVVFGGYLTATDMALGQPTLGSPEWSMGILAGAQMARHYGLPFRGGGGWSSAKTVDAQSGYETVMGVWPALLSGTNFMLHAAGALESTMIISAEKMVLDFEVLRMFEWMLDPGLPVDDETLAFDAIAKTGPGGLYLALPHTADNFRSALYRSELASLEDVNLWTEQGSKDTLVRANERYREILEAYEDPGLDDAIDAELQEFMARRKSEIKTSTGGN
jgi:trimethylamine--corrinoid protein Co-methyltransferase